MNSNKSKKYYKVDIPVGYEVFKYLRAESSSDAKNIALEDIKNDFETWEDYGGETIYFLQFAKVKRISKSDYEDSDPKPTSQHST